MSSPVAFADVVVPRHLNQSFTYRVPRHLQHSVQVGSRVRIPFGSSIVQGVVVSLSPTFPNIPVGGLLSSKGLRDILSTLERTVSPELDRKLLDLARLVSRHYLAPLGQCARLVLPPERVTQRSDSYAITASGRSALQENRQLSDLSRTVLARLAGAPAGLTFATLKRSCGSQVGRALPNLEKKQWIRQWVKDARADTGPSSSGGRAHRVPVSPLPATDTGGPDAEPPTLPGAPLAWRERLSAAFRSSKPSGFVVRAPVLHRLACLVEAGNEALKRKRAVLVVTAEIDRAEMMARRATGWWGARVEALHSGLSLAQRAEAWDRIRSGLADVVVGSRSAIFAPLHSLGLVYVEAEHESALKGQQEPRYHARDVAWMRARQSRAVLLLGADHPTVETHRALVATGQALDLQEGRPGGPVIESVDLRRFPYGVILSDPLLQGIEAALRAKAGAYLYHNRKGFASSLLCRDCGGVPRCPRCRVALTLYRTAGRLTCRYCSQTQSVPDACPWCLATRLEPMGFGTERIEGELRRQFPRARIARLDRDSSRLSGQADRVRRRTWAGEVDILIGTQMLTSGTPLPRAGFVGVPLADTGLHLPDFRAAERTYHALMEIIALACPADQGGRVLIQSYLPHHHVIAAAVQGNSESFYEQELAFRRSLGYPPYGTVVSLKVCGRVAERTRDAATRCAELLRQVGAQCPSPDHLAPRETGGLSDPLRSQAQMTILGPVPAIAATVRGHASWQLLVKSEDGLQARYVIDTVIRRLEGQREFRDQKFDVDVDPIEM